MKNISKKNIPAKKIFYDEREDIMWVVFKEGTEERYEELTPDIKLEYDKNNNLIGIELLNASKNQTAYSTIVSDRNTNNYFEDITENQGLNVVRDIIIKSDPIFQTL